MEAERPLETPGMQVHPNTPIANLLMSESPESDLNHITRVEKHGSREGGKSVVDGGNSARHRSLNTRIQQREHGHFLSGCLELPRHLVGHDPARRKSAQVIGTFGLNRSDVADII